MVDAFFDESIQRNGDELFLVVAAVVTTDRRHTELAVKRLKRKPKLKLKAHSELKASASSREAVKGLLQALAQDPSVVIYAGIWQGKHDAMPDFESVYQTLIARVALQIVRHNVRADLHIDKRYNNRKRQQQLEQRIREQLVRVPKNVVRVFQEDSQVVKELTSADFVAWAYMQRYCYTTDEFYNLFKARVAIFEDLST